MFLVRSSVFLACFAALWLLMYTSASPVRVTLNRTTRNAVHYQDMHAIAIDIRNMLNEFYQQYKQSVEDQFNTTITFVRPEHVTAPSLFLPAVIYFDATTHADSEIVNEHFENVVNFTHTLDEVNQAGSVLDSIVSIVAKLRLLIDRMAIVCNERDSCSTQNHLPALLNDTTVMHTLYVLQELNDYMPIIESHFGELNSRHN